MAVAAEGGVGVREGHRGGAGGRGRSREISLIPRYSLIPNKTAAASVPTGGQLR